MQFPRSSLGGLSFRMRFRAIIVALALIGPAPGVAARAQSPAPAAEVKCASGLACTPVNDLYKRMTLVNGKLKTYKADIHVDVQLKTFPYISPALNGNVYYKQPNREAVVLDTVPAIANQFKKIYPHLDSPSDWFKVYDVAALSNESGVTLFRLVPRKNGRVEHLDVKVDDSTATIKGYTWTYKDGGFVTFDQTFKSQDGNYLVDKQNGHVELSQYKADVVSVFSNYKLNVAVDDAVFAEK